MAEKINWDYKKIIDEMQPEGILQAYNYDNGFDIIETIQKLDISDEKSLKAVLNEIVLWKCNRRIMRKKTGKGNEYGTNTKEQDNEICKTIEEIKNINDTSNNTDGVEKIIRSLMSFNGIRLPMASTIMNFFNPNAFPIIDKRAYRVAMKLTCGNEDARGLLYREPSIDKAGDYYIGYLDACKKVAEEYKEVEFKLIDKFLYQIDKSIGNQVDGVP